VVLTAEDKTILSERKGKGIWQGMYQFPLLEVNQNITGKELISNEGFMNLLPNQSSISLFNKKEIVHKLSHQHLYTQFWIVKTKNSPAANINWIDVEKYPVPVLIANFLNAFKAEK
jgi:A/G-specific adenine glycosylase